MANSIHVDFLLESLGDPSSGRKAWVDFKLRNAPVDLSHTDFSNQDLRDYDFSETDLTGASFFGADLTGADFSDAQISGGDFRRAIMCNCCLDRADLSSAGLQGAQLADACVEEANLSEARMQGADLIGADFADSDLTGADLRNACLKYTRLTGARLDGANVAEADLTGSVIDDEAIPKLRNFDLAIVDDRRYREMKSQVRPTEAKRDPLEDTVRERIPEEARAAAETAMAGAGAPGAAAWAGSATPPRAEAGPRQDWRHAAADSYEERADARFEPRPESPPRQAPPPPPRQPPPAPEPPPKAEAKPAESKPAEPKAEEKVEKKGFFRRTVVQPKEAPPPPARSGAAPVTADNPLGLDYVARAIDLETDEGCARVLGVRVTATQVQITKAFRSKAMLLHPDRTVKMEEAIQKFARDQFEFARRAHDILRRRSANPLGDIRMADGVAKRNSVYDYTLAELHKLAKANERNELVLYTLAYKSFEAGKLDDAETYFGRVLDVNPRNEDAAHNLKAVRLKKLF